MANAVIKKYACNYTELLTDRISNVADDIEIFLSMPLMSPAATMFVFIRFPSFFLTFFSSFFFDLTRAQSSSSTITKERERKPIVETTKNEQAKSNIELDENIYKRAITNDFFSKAFGPSQSELKPNQPHSIRSTFENIAGGFFERPPPGAQRETLATIKEEMRKKKIRIDTKN
jgi:hypothetical protein